MPVLVMKFGGTSVANIDRIRRVAKRVGVEVAKGYDVIVVVSAMSGKTNELVGWVRDISPLYDAREYDAVVSSGENVTAGLMALTLQEMNIPARSWQGWQVPLRTNSSHSSARIEEIPPDNIIAKFDEGMRVAVVAGFQGISPEGRITTLGRGGADTTAVAFAAAFALTMFSSVLIIKTASSISVTTERRPRRLVPGLRVSTSYRVTAIHSDPVATANTVVLAIVRVLGSAPSPCDAIISTTGGSTTARLCPMGSSASRYVESNTIPTIANVAPNRPTIPIPNRMVNSVDPGSISVTSNMSTVTNR